MSCVNSSEHKTELMHCFKSKCTQCEHFWLNQSLQQHSTYIKYSYYVYCKQSFYSVWQSEDGCIPDQQWQIQQIPALHASIFFNGWMQLRGGDELMSYILTKSSGAFQYQYLAKGRFIFTQGTDSDFGHSGPPKSNAKCLCPPPQKIKNI